MAKNFYPSITAAIEAGKSELSGKYGTHPSFYILRNSKGYVYSVTCDSNLRSIKFIPGTTNYFQEAIQTIIGGAPPFEVPPYGVQGMGDEVIALQDWCADNARPPWATGLSMIEAAELIVNQALENANIKRE